MVGSDFTLVVLDQRRLAEVAQRARRRTSRSDDRSPGPRMRRSRPRRECDRRQDRPLFRRKRERDHARSASRISHDTGFQIAPASMPRRSLSRLGFGDAGIADEQQLGIELQRPQRRSQLQVRQHRGAQTDVGAERIDQRVDALDRRDAVGRIDADRRAARVVAVKALADVDEELRLAPGPEDQRELRADDRIVGAAGVRGKAAARRRSRSGRRAGRAPCARARSSASSGSNRPSSCSA